MKNVRKSFKMNEVVSLPMTISVGEWPTPFMWFSVNDPVLQKVAHTSFFLKEQKTK